MPYPRLELFTAPARARAEWLRSLAGLILIAGIYWGAVMGALALLYRFGGPIVFAAVVMAMERGGTPGGLVLVMLSFLPLAAGVMLVTRFLHRRPIASLFGTGAFGDFLKVFPTLLGLVALVAATSALDPNLGKSTPLPVLLNWLPIALPLLFIQIASEELLFRGYFLQQMGARSRARLLWMVLPAALFGALHYAPDENGPTAIIFVLWAMLFGCLSADLTARAGNLGPSLAFHFANNISAIFLVGLYGQLDGLSLYTLVINTRDIGAMAPYLALDALAIVTFWLAARLRLRR
ncbi:hypothetical protein C8J30_10255 [Rhodobacter viridis]|uniref:CAAX prenyl protease 2/Lysostaphin resistance protein A-like domain-containing protein n=1 Tax=Rhodobacter viridis TaxID=1054202 RepID=A0A318U4B4_9RHOB|nr:CPBP family intramembrane glutamic endopeptidase [Rhodobacter viridis]PYF11745.1 hypothetical protein C8J30_10255 [Rhodobacter viridis]